MKGIWPSERVNSQVDWLRADLAGTSAFTFTDKYFRQSQQSKQTPDSNSVSHCVRSHLLGLLLFSSLPRACSVSRPSSLTLSRLFYCLLYSFSTVFTLHLMSPCFSWPAEHITAPPTPHRPGKAGGREETFSSRSSPATRQYETLITERSGLGNAWLENRHRRGFGPRSAPEPSLSITPRLRWASCVHLDIQLQVLHAQVLNCYTRGQSRSPGFLSPAV